MKSPQRRRWQAARPRRSPQPSPGPGCFHWRSAPRQMSHSEGSCSLEDKPLLPAGGAAQGSRLKVPRWSHQEISLCCLCLLAPGPPERESWPLGLLGTRTLECHAGAAACLPAFEPDTAFIPPLLAGCLRSVTSHRVCHGITAPAVMSMILIQNYPAFARVSN